MQARYNHIKSDDMMPGSTFIKYVWLEKIWVSVTFCLVLFKLCLHMNCILTTI